MNPLDRLRQAGNIPDAYSWASIAITAVEARALVEHIDRLAARVDELETAARRCSKCGRGARELQPVYEDVDGKPQITGWLGPGCWRKHLDELREAAVGGQSCFLIQVPLGGAR